jgi:hypothetical protein
VLTTTIASAGSLDVQASPNGGIRVEAWDDDRIEVVARLTARASTEEGAEEIAREVVIALDGDRVDATGPRTGRREGWTVSYRVRVPRDTDLSLRTTNGGIEVGDVAGSIDVHAVNGGVTLRDLSGDVRGRTTNGSVEVQLAGARWSGSGLDVQTTNGRVTLVVPEDYSADLDVGTTNGGIEFDFPVTVQGRIGRNMATTLGSGGAPIRARTTNGGVRVVER